MLFKDKAMFKLLQKYTLYINVKKIKQIKKTIKTSFFSYDFFDLHNLLKHLYF